MFETDLLIAVASWEYRFLAGFKREIDINKPKAVVMFFYYEYKKETHDIRLEVENICKSNQISFTECELSFEDEVTSWKNINSTLVNIGNIIKNITLDLSTMPREAIWTITDFLAEKKLNVRYIYNRPHEYNKDWLSRDPGRPRVVFKLGGILKLGLPTTLLITTGFDLDRIRQLVTFFEPQVTFLGLQTGNQYGNSDFNAGKCRKEYEKYSSFKLFEVDAYSKDHGFSSIEPLIKKHYRTSNIIMTSLGPKLSAIALYLLHRKYPGTSLVYTPSNEFNPEYSNGIENVITGQLNFSEQPSNLRP